MEVQNSRVAPACLTVSASALHKVFQPTLPKSRFPLFGHFDFSSPAVSCCFHQLGNAEELITTGREKRVTRTPGQACAGKSERQRRRLTTASSPAAITLQAQRLQVSINIPSGKLSH